VIQAMADVPVLAPAEEPAPSGQGKKNLLILIVVAVLVLVGGGIAAWFAVATQSGKKPGAVKQAPLAPPQYVALDPPFVVNFENDQQVRFLQVTAQLMSRDPATIDLLRANDPVVRNDLLLLFGGQKYSVVSTREGKEQLRAQTLTAVRKVVAAAGGRPERVEAVYFTSFVMQ
jgi:flagellar FliL protein